MSTTPNTASIVTQMAKETEQGLRHLLDQIEETVKTARKRLDTGTIVPALNANAAFTMAEAIAAADPLTALREVAKVSASP